LRTEIEMILSGCVSIASILEFEGEECDSPEKKSPDSGIVEGNRMELFRVFCKREGWAHFG
jgi:hypothetical protein